MTLDFSAPICPLCQASETLTAKNIYHEEISSVEILIDDEVCPFEIGNVHPKSVVGKILP